MQQVIRVRPGWCKARILQALYNSAGPTGMGALNHTPGDLGLAEAWQLIRGHNSYFDYLNGRGLKLDLRQMHHPEREWNHDVTTLARVGRVQ